MEKLKAQSEHLDVGLSHEEILNIFGKPTSLANYHFETNATEGHLVMTIQRASFTTNNLNEIKGPYSIYYEPPGWEERGGNYFFRRLAIDLTADGRIYQWYFDPIPLSSDW